VAGGFTGHKRTHEAHTRACGGGEAEPVSDKRRDTLENVAIKADPARHFQVSPKEHMPSVYKAMVMVGLEDGGHSDLDAKEAWALRVKLGPVQTVLCLSAEYYQALKKQFKKDKTKANMRQAVNLKAKLYMKLHAKVTGASGCPAMTDKEVRGVIIRRHKS
jgi:hypothetical protein